MNKLIVALIMSLSFFAGCANISKPQVIPPRATLINDPTPTIAQVSSTVAQVPQDITTATTTITKQSDAIDTQAPAVKNNTDIIRTMVAQINADAAKISALTTQMNSIQSSVKDLESTIAGEPQRQAAAIQTAVSPLQTNIKNLTTANAKLEKSSQENMKSVYSLMGFLIVAGVIAICIGGFVVFALKNTTWGFGVIISGVLGVISGIGVIMQAFWLGIIGGAIMVIFAGILAYKILQDQWNTSKELVQTAEITKAALATASPAAAAAIFNPVPAVQTADSIQSNLTKKIVSAVKASSPSTTTPS